MPRRIILRQFASPGNPFPLVAENKIEPEPQIYTVCLVRHENGIQVIGKQVKLKAASAQYHSHSHVVIAVVHHRPGD